jgi:xanthine dehydrogenase/oxidase
MESNNTLITSCTEQVVHSNISLDEELNSSNRSEPIFPPALTRFTPSEVLITKHGVTWYQPITLASLLQFKCEHPESRLVVGNTEVGIEIKFKNMVYPYVINPSFVGELKVLQIETNGLRVGSAVTLRRLKDFITRIDPNHDDIATRGYTAISHMLEWFASNHIRNVACVGGNIVTASPISDLNPMLCACGAILRLVSVNGSRDVPITEFFLSYRKVDLRPDEILQDVFIPFTSKWEYVVPLKQAKRREDDISIVTAGIRVLLTPSSNNEWIVDDCSLAFGGMAPTTVLAKKAMSKLRGSVWRAETLDDVYVELYNELLLPTGVPGGQAEYRNSLTTSFLYRAFLRISLDLHESVLSDSDSQSLPPPPQIAENEISAADGFLTTPKSLSRGEQGYYKREGGLSKSTHEPDGDESSVRAPVGEPIQHKSANLQTTGEAVYTDDIVAPGDVYHSAVVLSTKAHAYIKSINIDKCSQCPGFVRFFSASDVIGRNETGAIFHDEEFFVSKEVKHVGAVS